MKQIGIVLLLALPLGACDCGESATSSRQAIAKCAAKRGDVRSHPARSATWDPLAIDAALVAGDWIQTAADAWALIEFHSGSKLEIDPGSVVVLDELEADESGGVVSLRSGTVRGSSKRALVVETPAGKRVKIAPATGTKKVGYRVTASEKGEVKLAVTEGRAKVKGEDGRTVTLSSGQAHDVKKGALVGEVFAVPKPPEPAGPAAGGEVEAEPRSPVELSWKPKGKDETFRVQVSLDPSFSKIIVDETTSESQYAFTPQQHGTYYWRVASKERGLESAFGSPQKLGVVEPVPDLLEQPADGAVITFRRGKPLVKFTWREPKERTGAYQLVVSASSDLSNPALTEQTASLRAKTRALEAGTYYWGVYAQEGTKRKRLFKKARKLTLKRSRRGLTLPRKLKWE